MKKTVFGLMLCGAVTLGSCNLDTIPTDKYTVETFWETEEGTEAAMSGCYNVLTSSALFGDSAPLRHEYGANEQRLGAETEARENQTHGTQLPRKTNRLYFETRDGDDPSRHHAFPYCSLLPSRLPRAFCVRRSHRWHAICQRSLRNRDRYDECHAQPFRPLQRGRQLPERHRHASRARKQERPRVC